jgi:hypothetical protein
VIDEVDTSGSDAVIAKQVEAAAMRKKANKELESGEDAKIKSYWNKVRKNEQVERD